MVPRPLFSLQLLRSSAWRRAAAHARGRSLFAVQARCSSSSSSSHEFAFPLNLAKPGDNPLEFYEKMVKEGNIREDPRQHAAVKQLERVWKDLEANKGKVAESGGFLQKLFGGGKTRRQEAPVGLYMYGGVGCGKTFIMDLFYVCADVKRKRRSHFHSFMLEVHDRLHELRKKGRGRADVDTVGKQIVKESGSLFCFDEFNVTDVGDAVILRTLFDSMWDEGIVVVTTSNRPPDDLYRNGIQRDLFLPCIASIKERCSVFDMDSNIDFRLLMTSSLETYIVTEEGEEKIRQAEVNLDRWFTKLAHGHPLRTMTLVTQGRKIKVKLTAAGVASFEFSELCSLPTGAADFLALARAFHTVIIHNIPMLSMERLPEVRRLITLIDILYDHKVKLICSAAAEPFKLFRADKSAMQDEAFAFDRTASRIQDMMSQEYMIKMHNPSVSSIGEDIDVCPGLAELHHEVTEEELQEIWMRYDKDASGKLSKSELRTLMEDVSLIKKGHRNVRDVVLEEAFTSLDADGDGFIDKHEFMNFAARSGFNVWYIV